MELQSATALRHWQSASEAGQLAMGGIDGAYGGGPWMTRLSPSEAAAAREAAEELSQAAAVAGSLEQQPLPPLTEEDETEVCMCLGGEDCTLRNVSSVRCTTCDDMHLVTMSCRLIALRRCHLAMRKSG